MGGVINNSRGDFAHLLCASAHIEIIAREFSALFLSLHMLSESGLRKHSCCPSLVCESTHGFARTLRRDRQAKGIAGNIVHAIASTNAIAAGLIVLEAIKVS